MPTAQRKIERPRATASARIPTFESSANEARQQSELNPEDVARLAYGYWEARNGEPGSPEDDWFRAEHELRSRRAIDERIN